MIWVISTQFTRLCLLKIDCLLRSALNVPFMSRKRNAHCMKMKQIMTYRYSVFLIHTFHTLLRIVRTYLDIVFYVRVQQSLPLTANDPFTVHTVIYRFSIHSHAEVVRHTITQSSCEFYINKPVTVAILDHGVKPKKFFDSDSSLALHPGLKVEFTAFEFLRLEIN